MVTKKARRYGTSDLWADADEKSDKKGTAPKLGSPSPSTAAKPSQGQNLAASLAGVSKDDSFDVLSQAMGGANRMIPGTGLDLGSVGRLKSSPRTAPRNSGKKPSEFWFNQLTDAVGKVSKSFEPKMNKPGDVAGNIGSMLKRFMSGAQNPNMEGSMEELPEFGKTLAQYLAEAGDGSQLMGEQNALFDARQDALTKRAGVSDAALQALYSQLGNSMGQAAERESGRYAEQADIAKSRTDATQGNIAAARAQASDAEKAVAENLGLGDRSQSISAQQAAVDGSMAQGATAARGLSQQELMQSMGNAQNDYFRGNEAAAGFRGAEARASMQAELQSRLAQIQEDRTSAQSNAAAEARALAAQQYAADYGQFNDQRSYRDSRDQTAYDRSWQQTQAQNEMRLGQQQIKAEQEARLSEESARYAAEQEKRTPAYARIQQQLASAMPPERAALAMEEIAKARLTGKDPVQALSDKSKFTAQEMRMALQAANDYNSNYKN